MDRADHRAVRLRHGARLDVARRGKRAMLQLVRDMEAGKPAGFTVDGPRGPARVAQPGAVWLARATGNPVLPFHLEASAHWTLRSWDRTQIPKPFSTVALVVGEPMAVAADAADSQLELARLELEHRLAALEARARELSVRRSWPSKRDARRGRSDVMNRVSPPIFFAPAESLP